MKELFGKGMEVLLEHYDPVTGRRRLSFRSTRWSVRRSFSRMKMFSGLGDKHKGH